MGSNPTGECVDIPGCFLGQEKGRQRVLKDSAERFRNPKSETSWAALVCRRTIERNGGGQGGEGRSNVHQPHADQRWSNHTKICMKKR